MKNLQKENKTISGTDRINEIKKNIAASKPAKLCTVPVFEMWDEENPSS